MTNLIQSQQKLAFLTKIVPPIWNKVVAFDDGYHFCKVIETPDPENPDDPLVTIHPMISVLALDKLVTHLANAKPKIEKTGF